MPQILTIDFDITMGPSIELYNDIIGDNKGIDTVIKQYPLLEYTLTGDLFIYEALTRQLLHFFKQLDSNDVYFIREHQTTVQLLKDIDNFTLINIDHHHDLGYTNSLKIYRPDCGNWVKYLQEQQKIDNYIWFNNANSDYPKDKRYLNYSLNIKEVDFRQIGKIDKLIICNSPQWVPPNLQALFMSWVGLAEEYYGTSYRII